jgi:hypothetical protein
VILNDQHKFIIRKYAILKYSLQYQGELRGVGFHKYPQPSGVIVLGILTGEPVGMFTNWPLDGKTVSEQEADELIKEASVYRDEILEGLSKIL